VHSPLIIYIEKFDRYILICAIESESESFSILKILIFKHFNKKSGKFNLDNMVGLFYVIHAEKFRTRA
jgi:hypothetical protein